MAQFHTCWICMNKSYKNFYKEFTSSGASSSKISLTLGFSETYQGVESDLGTLLITYTKELSAREKSTPHEPDLVTQIDEPSLWQIAKYGLYLTTWIASDVITSMVSFKSFVLEFEIEHTVPLM
ncbi:hypothetical protein S245_030502 [Arachis hypogaea]